MDTVRYVIALLILISMPFGFIFWLLIHPLARFWRRRGPAVTYTLITAIGMVLAALVYRVRSSILAVEYGTSYPLVALGVMLIIGAMVIGWQRRRLLTFRILAGVPEVSESAGPGRLLNEGIYSRIRHPRYVEAVLGLSGYALIVNYLAIYVAVAVGFPFLYLIVLLEERELRERFGAAYVQYCRDVPRFIPRFSRPPLGSRSG
jgi:protein-S-isoprenylcysteine O-methyltransferase Ste14